MKWEVGTFKPYKAAGIDVISPALLQQGIDILASALVKLFRACLTYGYIPISWRTARVVFLPKPGRSQHSKTGDYRPISLTSFMLKTLERLVDRYIRDGPLIVKPLHTRQHAYQTGKSVDTALIEAVGYMQACMNNRGMLLAAMLGMDGAFNHTSSTSIMRDME